MHFEDIKSIYGRLIVVVAFMLKAWSVDEKLQTV